MRPGHHRNYTTLTDVTHVAEQIGALALAQDETGIATWQAIAKRVAELMGKDRPTRLQ